MTEEKKTVSSEEIWEEVSPIMGNTWDFKTDKQIIGVYIRKDEKVGPNESNLYIIKVGDDEVGVWGTTMLDSRFRGIEVGMEVKIEYTGLEKSEKSGREYHNFIVSKRAVPFSEVKDQGKKKDEDIPVINTDE